MNVEISQVIISVTDVMLMVNKGTSNCKTVTNQCLEVETPVKLEAITEIEDIDIRCCPPKIICKRRKQCGNRFICEFVVKQNIAIELPINYHVAASTGPNNCSNI